MNKKDLFTIDFEDNNDVYSKDNNLFNEEENNIITFNNKCNSNKSYLWLLEDEVQYLRRKIYNDSINLCNILKYNNYVIFIDGNDYNIKEFISLLKLENINFSFMKNDIDIVDIKKEIEDKTVILSKNHLLVNNIKNNFNCYQLVFSDNIDINYTSGSYSKAIFDNLDHDKQLIYNNFLKNI